MVEKLTYEERCRDRDFHFHIHYSVFSERFCPIHIHEFAELVVVRHGRGRHAIEGREYPLTAGDVFVVKPNDAHGYKDIDGLDICNLQFAPPAFLDPNSDLNHVPGYHALFHLEPILRHDHGFESKLHVHEERMHHVYDLIGCIEREYTGRRPGFQSMVGAHFRLLVGFLSREYTQQDASASRALLNLSRVVSFIEGSYQDPITLEELADVAHMSKNSLLRSFKRCYNTSPIDYLIRYRLTRACELLKDMRLSVTDIVYQVGFSDCSYFTRQFRNTYGMTPREYRKKTV